MTLPAAITAIIKSNGEDFVAWSCGTLLTTPQLGATTPYIKIFCLGLSIITNKFEGIVIAINTLMLSPRSNKDYH